MPRQTEPGPASRAGGKLAAGIERFGLAGAVRGARAVDIGASTGGFTELLLERGAAHVTAVDVGQGQLHARLRGDRRVDSHERTDWKTLALDRLPGPFDFFTIDVSFVAARSMLRSLAFRLRAGAQGVVLVKPQFELPPRPLEELARPEVRSRALAVFRKKAEALGFALAGQIDSPVAGRSGTVELLVHLKFASRPASLPARKAEEEVEGDGGKAAKAAKAAKPQKKATPPKLPRKRARGAVTPGAELRWFAVVAPGLEEVARAEVERLPGVRAVEAVPGGIAFAGPLAVGAAANLWLRVATRVLVRVGTVKAREFSKLRRLLGKLDFAPFVPPDLPLRLGVSTTRCRLYHTKAIAETVAQAIGDRLGSKMRLAAPATEEDGAVPAAEREPPVPDHQPASAEAEALETRVLVRGENDVWTVSVDASGELLHRRGWRQEAGRAPLRETLAAGVLALAAYRPGEPLIDAMCGAGTLAIEAAAIAANRAPGLGRSYALERWPGWQAPPATDAARPAAKEMGRPLATPARPDRGAAPGEGTRAAVAAAPAEGPPGALAAAPIFGWDRDAAVLERARRNAERAGVGGAIAFERRQVQDWRAPEGVAPGLVVINPPYGRRLANPAAARALAGQIGQALRAHLPGWRVALLVPDPRWSTRLGLEVTSVHPLVNGGLRVHLVLARVPVGRRAG